MAIETLTPAVGAAALGEVPLAGAAPPADSVGLAAEVGGAAAAEPEPDVAAVVPPQADSTEQTNTSPRT
ncbi:MAG: hypothetical protein JOZ39_03795 [Chloroflexi bacterium]|nr:hypothetical protein [Chloroflexota bacterium]